MGSDSAYGEPFYCCSHEEKNTCMIYTTAKTYDDLEFMRFYLNEDGLFDLHHIVKFNKKQATAIQKLLKNFGAPVYIEEN